MRVQAELGKEKASIPISRVLFMAAVTSVLYFCDLARPWLGGSCSSLLSSAPRVHSAEFGDRGSGPGKMAVLSFHVL